jgi:opacity protein-like surface antigen
LIGKDLGFHCRSETLGGNARIGKKREGLENPQKRRANGNLKASKKLYKSAFCELSELAKPSPRLPIQTDAKTIGSFKMQFHVGRFVILAFVVGCSSQLWAQSESQFQGEKLIQGEKLKASIRPADNASGPMNIQSKQGNVARIRIPATTDNPAKVPMVSGSSSLAKQNLPNSRLSLSDDSSAKEAKASATINRAQTIPTQSETVGKNTSHVRQASFLAAGQQSAATQETDQDQAIYFPETRTDPIFIEPQDKVAPAPFKLQTSPTPSPGPLPMPKERTILQPPSGRIPAQQFSSRQESILPPLPANLQAGEANLPPRNPTASSPNYMPFNEQQLRLMQQPPSPSASAPPTSYPPTSYPPANFLPAENFEWESFDNHEYDAEANGCSEVGGDWGLFHATAFVGNNSLRDFGIRRGGAIQNVEASDGFLGGLQLGINHGRNLRADYELSYRTNDIATQPMPAPFWLPYEELLKGEISTFSGLSNLYWDFADVDVFGIKPYVGAGLGFAYFDVDLRERNHVSAMSPDSRNNSNLAYQWIVGVNGQATRCLDWFVEYRHFNGGEIQFELNENYFGPRSLNNGDYVSNSVLAGLKFKF